MVGGLPQLGFQDYIDYDFAILSRDERATYMTHPVSNQLSQKFDHPDFRSIFQDKVEFDRVFDEHLHREWMVVEHGNGCAGAGVRAPARPRHGKEPVGDRAPACIATTRPRSPTGTGSAPVCSQGASCSSKRSSSSIPTSPAVCPGTVNTTRVTAFFDGERTHILAMAQKFGRGAVSDQMTFGGFYTMLDEDGARRRCRLRLARRTCTRCTPTPGFRIADFQLPMMDEVRAFIDRVARVVPQVQYVGWDIVVDARRARARRGQLGRGRVREQAERHRHPHRAQAAVPRGDRFLSAGAH